VTVLMKTFLSQWKFWH